MIANRMWGILTSLGLNERLYLAIYFTWFYIGSMRLLQNKPNHQTKILILGAGYAGLSAIHKLKHLKNTQITLIDRHPYHTIVTELHEAAAHNHDVALKLEPMLSGIQFFPANIENVNLDQKEVQTSQGKLEYDYLIIALGSSTNFFRIPGLSEHALELKSTEDAQQIYTKFTALHHQSQHQKQIVIGGAGLTGVELATELAIRSQALTRDGNSKMQIHLVEAGQEILPSIEPKLRTHALETLQARGVQIHLGQRIIEANTNSVTLENGTVLESALTIWTGGVRAADVVYGTHLERGIGNRLKVNSQLALEHYPNVFVAGDMALALDTTGKPVPPTAQHAGHQGTIAANNLKAKIAGQTPRDYKPSSLGELISLGGWLGVGWMQLPLGKRLRLLGIFASLVKRATIWKHTIQARGWL
jgi:NADH:ubiquinone reductase (H+-translocating)